MGMFKWLRKDFVQWDRSRRNNLASPERRGLNNEAYRSALQAFLERRREPGEGSEASQSPNSSPAGVNNRVEIFSKNINSEKRPEERQIVPGVPHVEASEVFEVGWVAGTEDRYLELIAAEWQHTRTALRRSSHPDCFTAVRADLDVLTEIRHPNTLLLMGTTRTDEHGIVAIFESVDCTLYNYVHEQGERVSVQGAARCAGQIADALRHAHARGIVHGAISSHCVFLAASGSAKLGGWELAVREDEPRPYRDWEERLRTEIFRWKAPEMFYGDSPTRACDVYALALLIWEMCTGRVPWSGLTEAEIERQYIHWERGVATDAYNFPPLLGNLLESGLQLDPNKRKLDMNRTRRFLRRIELRYEDEEPTFVDRQSNNNNPNVKTFNAPVATSPVIKSPATTPKRDSIDINNSLMIGKKLFNSERTGQKYSNTNKNKIEKYDELDKNNVISSNANIYSENVVKNSTITAPEENESLESNDKTLLRRGKKVVYSDAGKRQRRSVNDNSSDFEEGEKRNAKNLVAYANSFSGTSTTAVETPSSSGDESTNDTITDLKKLKEIIAAKRSNFFYGNSPPVNQEASASNDESDARSSPRLREKILEEARGKSCEPCKPASHKVNVEPQVCKSPSEYDPTLIKPASHQNQRATILQPQTTNQNSASFFESSLWRKEKLICLSKMRKGNPNEEKDLSGVCDKDILAKTSDSPGSDSTYVIEDDNKPVEKVTRDFGDTGILDAEESTSPRTPLQALKEALDRATEIINSGSQSGENSMESSPIKGVNNVDIIFDESEANESIFQMINRSKLGNNDPDGEIKSIERSTNGDRDSLLALGKSFAAGAEEPQPSSAEKEKSRCVSFGKTTRDGAEDSQISTIDTSLIKRLHDFTCDDFYVDPDDSLNQLAERSLISTAMVFLSSKSQEKGCKSCQHRNLLARRRSLPAGLGQFRSVGNASPLGRLPIRKADVPDSTVEDLYIDDEFGDNLNINMVLLEGEDEPDEQDLLSSLLHSPEA